MLNCKNRKSPSGITVPIDYIGRSAGLHGDLKRRVVHSNGQAVVKDFIRTGSKPNTVAI